jgi:hypothetical protein
MARQAIANSKAADLAAALALGFGSCRPLHGLVKFSSGIFRIRDGKYEAHLNEVAWQAFAN